MSEATALAVVSGDSDGPGPIALMRQATDVAAVCREIVLRTAMDLQGRRYVRVEGWMSIAATYGCVPSIRSVEEDERGVKAVAELRKHDGTVLATAEGYVGLDEPRWANQPMYARRGMAQTRAVSRVCRSVFAFVVTLIDSGLSTTPAEEIPQGGEAANVDAPRPTPTPIPAVVAGQKAPERTPKTKVRFGRTKGQYLCDIEASDLAWQLSAAQASVNANDPKWGASNKEWLATVQAEVARRGSK